MDLNYYLEKGLWGIEYYSMYVYIYRYICTHTYIFKHSKYKGPTIADYPEP